MSDTAVEAVLRRDRVIVAAALAVLTALAWAYVLWLADDMEMGGMDMSGFRMIPAGMGLMMPATAPWTLIELAFVFVMWAVMMIGMMTPSVAPMLLIYTRVGRRRNTEGHWRRAPILPPVIFSPGPALPSSQPWRSGPWNVAPCSQRRWRARAICSAARC
jgi:predicted metal-binding membrane protein